MISKNGIKKYTNKETSEFVEYLSEVSEITRIKKISKKIYFLFLLYSWLYLLENNNKHESIEISGIYIGL